MLSLKVYLTLFQQIATLIRLTIQTMISPALLYPVLQNVLRGAKASPAVPCMPTPNAESFAGLSLEKELLSLILTFSPDSRTMVKVGSFVISGL